MQYLILNRVRQISYPRCVFIMLLIVSVLIIVTGCGYSYSYKEALAENTPFSYMKFIELNPRSKDREAARQHLDDLFKQANIKKITICYLTVFDEAGENLGQGQLRAYSWGGNVRHFDESAASYEGGALWATSIKTMVEKELKAKGYQLQFGNDIRTILKNKRVNGQLHSVTSQYPSESVDYTVNIDPGGYHNRLTPPHYFAIEPFLTSRSWPDSDAVLLVTIPFVRNAVDYADFNRYGRTKDTSEISCLSIAYHLFDVASKIQVFGDYIIYLRRERVTDPDRGYYDWRTGSSSSYWHFTENTEQFFSRVVSKLFKDFPAVDDD